MSDNTPRPYAAKNYVAAALDEFVPPPPYVDVRPTPPPATTENNLGFVLTLANLMVTAIIVIAMMLDGTQAMTAIIVGSIYFAVTMLGFSLVVTGALGTIVAALAHEATERQRIDAYEALGERAIEWRVLVEQNRIAELQAQAMPQQLTRRIALLESELLERTLHVGGVQPPATFVPPFDNRSHAANVEPAPGDSSAQEAVVWLSGLYGDTGLPDPRKVQLVGDTASLGRLRVRMLGSKRGGGSREAGLWCLQQGVIAKVPGGYRLDLRHFPSREALRNLL